MGWSEERGCWCAQPLRAAVQENLKASEEYETAEQDLTSQAAALLCAPRLPADGEAPYSTPTAMSTVLVGIRWSDVQPKDRYVSCGWVCVGL